MRFQPSAHSPTTYGDAAITVTARSLPTLRQGSTDAQTGNAVSRVINALIRNGIPVAGLTSSIAPGRAAYGPKVVAAVKGFQKDYDLVPADGIVGPKTWEVILTLEATSGAKVSGGGMVAGGSAGGGGTTPITPIITPFTPSAPVTLPEGTTVEELKPSKWKEFREGKWFWPAVGGLSLTGVVIVGMVIYAARKSASKKFS